MRRRIFLTSALAAPALARAQPLWSPARSMRLVVPFAPGGALDIIARLLAWEMEAQLGSTIVVENRSGAGGNIGAEAVARSAPDGNTLLISSPGPLVVNPFIYSGMPFYPALDFTPVALVSLHPLLLLAGPARPERSLAHLTTALRGGAPLSYSSPGIGSTGHMAMEVLKARLGKNGPLHIPYRGAGPSMEALAAGHVDFAMESITSAIGFVEGGFAHPLAISTTQRWPGFGSVATLQEQGIADFDYGSWIAVVLPAGVPEEAVLLLNAAINGVLAQPEFRTRLTLMGAEPAGGTAASLTRHLREERLKWRDAVRISGARIA